MQLTNRTFIRADYSLFWNHSLSEWFSLYKTAAPGPFREAAAWYQNCIRNNVQGFVWIGTDSGFYVALRNRPLEGYFASAARENHQ